jgi:hypothetical protein
VLAPAHRSVVCNADRRLLDLTGSDPLHNLLRCLAPSGRVLPRLSLYTASGSHLVRSPIVQTSGDYRIVLRPGSWWGEPIDGMLGRVLMPDLAQRLPQSTVYASAGALSGSSPDATIELKVQRLYLDRDGQLLLIAPAG